MKLFYDVRSRVAAFVAKAIARARETVAYWATAGAGAMAALAFAPPESANGGWSLFSFSMDGAVDAMLAMAEQLFNGLVPVFGSIWGIALGIGLITLITAAIMGVIRAKKS